MMTSANGNISALLALFTRTYIPTPPQLFYGEFSDKTCYGKYSVIIILLFFILMLTGTSILIAQKIQQLAPISGKLFDI